MIQAEKNLITDNLSDSRIVPSLLKGKDVTYQEHLTKYNFALKYINKDSLVLDIASGVGWGSFLLSKYSRKVIGADHSLTAIEYAKDNYKASNLEFYPMSAYNLIFADNYFDMVVSIETIAQLKEIDKFLKEVKRVLKPGGFFLVSTVNREVFHPRGYRLSEFKKVLKIYFSEIEVYMQKMAYFGWVFRKFRQVLGGRFLGKILFYFLPFFEARYRNLKNAPLLVREILYELKYKLRILPYFEQGKQIKPNFYILVCKK